MNLSVAIIGGLVLGVAVLLLYRSTGPTMQRDFLEGPRSRFRPLQYGLVAGLLSGLLFLSIGIAGLFLDPNYAATPEHIVGILVLAAGAGIILGMATTAGMAWSFFVAGKYRDFLYPRLRKRQGPPQSSRNTGDGKS